MYSYVQYVMPTHATPISRAFGAKPSQNQGRNSTKKP